MYSQQHRCPTHSKVNASTETEHGTTTQKVASDIKKHHADPTKAADRSTSKQTRHISAAKYYCDEIA
ncbi:hypothetical protein PCIT_b0905 [Pseudoalteromonas citrea]|uniref:Uncharacterized protein n=2 Tax=Pseudoalteromonas citrea TaxID=43655 RepID=A0AAD4FQA9_9GAMM|nr:hypothetical protein PCIT_b0905 [Pseudoalteromonas citrea]